MAIKLLRLSLVLGLLGASAQADDRIRVMVIDTGVSKNVKAIKEVLCPVQEHFDATTDRVGFPPDYDGHGTHIAGIIRALAGNKGYCLATCKFYSEKAPGSVNVSNTVKCLKMAKQIGAAYVNYSAGGGQYSQVEYNALVGLGEAKIIVAAGNEHNSLDDPAGAYYPASYGLPNQIVVGAVDVHGQRLSTSNYGKLVSLEMLGDDVYSAGGSMTGTSQATAMATGAALRTLFRLPPIGKLADYAKFLFNFWTLQRQGSK